MGGWQHGSILIHGVLDHADHGHRCPCALCNALFPGKIHQNRRRVPNDSNGKHDYNHWKDAGFLHRHAIEIKAPVFALVTRVFRHPLDTLKIALVMQPRRNCALLLTHLVLDLPSSEIQGFLEWIDPVPVASYCQ
jgi:hypothetical protein